MTCPNLIGFKILICCLKNIIFIIIIPKQTHQSNDKNQDENNDVILDFASLFQTLWKDKFLIMFFVILSIPLQFI